MNQRNRWIAGASAFTVVALISMSFAQSVKAQPSEPYAPSIVVQEQGPVDLNLSWELVPRAPIKFTPFDMVDPNTGKPVRPDDWIEVNGVRVKAGEFYRRLNEMERWLNERGYSLRTDTHFEYYSPELEAQIADSERRLREFEARIPIEGEPGEDQFYPAACTGDSRSFDTNWYGNSLWGLRLYGSGSFQACFPGNNGSIASGTVNGQAQLDGRLANFTRTIAQANGAASGNLRMQYVGGSLSTYLEYSYNISVSVFGNQVWGPSGSGQVPLSYTRSWNWQIASFNWSSPTIKLGCISILGIPICLNGQVGVSGSAYLTASVDINLFAQTASVRPYGSASGWAAAWIGANAGLARVEAGVRGTLNFFNGGIEGRATGNLSIASNCALYNFNAQLNASISALSGQVEAFARGCIWFFGWRCAEGSIRLFSWDGLNWNQTIGQFSRTYPIYCW